MFRVGAKIIWWHRFGLIFHLQVSAAMKKDLYVFQERGMKVKDVGEWGLSWEAVWGSNSLSEDLLGSTSVKGFPIVSASATGSSQAMHGYIGRSEVRYVIGRSATWRAPCH